MLSTIFPNLVKPQTHTYSQMIISRDTCSMCSTGITMTIVYLNYRTACINTKLALTTLKYLCVIYGDEWVLSI